MTELFYTNIMAKALKEAQKAGKIDEVPVGAIIVDSAGKVIASAFNRKEQSFDPCGHAEILAIRKATKKLQNWRLVDCTLYVTLEPCIMCLAAMVHARIKTLVFGAYDPKGGALSLNYNLSTDQRLNHRFEVVGGVSQEECSRILSDFFQQKRMR